MSQVIDKDMAIAQAFDSVAATISPQHPYRNVILSMIDPRRPDAVEQFLQKRERDMELPNAIAKDFRDNTRRRLGKRFATLSDIRKSSPLMKANLDVGTLTNLASVTGGQSMGYVSLDTQLARGTVRPNSFTLYQALNKTRAFQVVDFWPYASDTGGGLPGTAFQGFAAAGTGTLATVAGIYQLESLQLKLGVNGRAITTALAAQNSFVDIAAQENINAAITILESFNWASYWGDSSVFANQFNGLAAVSGGVPAANIVDFQGWFNSYGASQGWSTQQGLFNLIYQWAAQITSYNQFGRITHAFMSPTCAGSLQGLVTTLLNNIVTGVGVSDVKGVIVNGDLQGMQTRFGEIQFPVDLYITARDKPAQAILNGNGTTMATTANPTKPASVTAVVSGTNAGSSWTAAYAAASGIYTYAAASCDAFMNESQLTFASAVSGIAANGAYVLTVTGPTVADASVFRIYRSGLGFTTATYTQNAASYRYIGAVTANGSGAVTFVDLNTKIAGAETIFLLDMDEADNAIDYRYLLPLTKVELFAQNLYMPWAVASIGALRVRIPKFHAIIKNYVGDNPDFNPLSANPNAV